MINLYNLKNWLSLKVRRKPNCYLFSSKSILIISILLCLYFLTMNIILIGKIKSRGPFQSRKLSDSEIFKNLLNKDKNSSTLNLVLKNEKSLFWPLPVKKIMIADATQFIRSPIAEFIEKLGFSELFPFISANMISFLHFVLSIVSIKFLSHDLLFWRQFGVCLFQFRNFLDSFDGVIYRAHAKKTAYKSHYGSLGYFVDAVSDTAGGVCLCVAVLIYFLKHLPPQTKFTKCIRVNETNPDDSDVEANPSCLKNIYMPLTTTNHSQSKTDKDSSYLYNQLNSTDKNDIDSSKDMNTGQNSTIFASKRFVIISVVILGLRIGISAMFWDRNVHIYQDLLDSEPCTEIHQQLQVLISEDNLSVLIMIMWRSLSALNLQDLILSAIFIDKTWEFIIKTQYIGWVILIGGIILTEFHIGEISSILSVGNLYKT